MKAATSETDRFPDMTASEAIKEVLREGGVGAMQPKDLSDATGKPRATIKSAVRRMHDAGELEKLDKGHGLYTLPSSGDNGGPDGGDLPGASHPEDDDLSSLLRSQTTMEIHTKAEAAAGNGRITYPDAHTYTVDVPRAFL